MGWLLSSWRWIVALRWWQRAGGAFLLVLLAVGGLRLHGQWRWQRVQADIAAAGLPTTVADLLRDQPPIDRDRQERLWQALQELGDLEERPWVAAVTRLWDDPPSPRDDGSALAADEFRFAPLLALLAEGGLAVSQAGWEPVAPDAIETLHRDLLRSMERWRSTPLAARTPVTWWAAQALRAEDPLPQVQALDAWQRACGHPVTLIDALVAMATASIRDDVYLWLALHGRLPGERLAAWGREPAQARRWVADGYAAERILFNEPQIRHPVGGMSPLLDACWATKPHQLAYTLRELAALEASLRSGPLPAPCPIAPFGLGIFSLIIPNLGEATYTAIEVSVRQRIRRVAGLIAGGYRAGLPLPTDVEACAARLPPGVLAACPPQEPAIRYELLGRSRFRVGCDPSWPSTAIPVDRLSASRRSTSAIGQPASSRAVDERRWSLEIDLDAILMPAGKGR